MEKYKNGKGPSVISLRPYPPYLQIRYHKKENNITYSSPDSKQGPTQDGSGTIPGRIKHWMKKMNLEQYFSPYRPYEFYRAGKFDPDMAAAASSVGLRYMFTKAGFYLPPQIVHMNTDFIALNYTTGQWDGWTPFETVNHVADLEKSEKKLLRDGEPGWLFGTIDTCLWTFGGEIWRSGSNLFEIAQFCRKGGNSGKLINVRPHTIAEYARIIAEMKN